MKNSIDWSQYTTEDPMMIPLVDEAIDDKTLINSAYVYIDKDNNSYETRYDKVIEREYKIKKLLK